MTMTDPIADMLTRVRNALKAKHVKINIPASKMKLEIAKILKEEGYIENFKLIEDGKQGVLEVSLKYTKDGLPAISGLKRISRPGRRIYCDKSDIPDVLGGYGIAILSTSQGIMTGKQSRTKGIGGEMLCSIW
jgi:small subunit ribosomal protein S8